MQLFVYSFCSGMANVVALLALAAVLGVAQGAPGVNLNGDPSKGVEGQEG